MLQRSVTLIRRFVWTRPDVSTRGCAERDRMTKNLMSKETRMTKSERIASSDTNAKHGASRHYNNRAPNICNQTDKWKDRGLRRCARINTNEGNSPIRAYLR